MKITPIFPIVILSLAPIAPAAAQLTPDNTLGTGNSVVTPVGQTGDRIDGGAARGSNLFHSFSDFNVDPGRSVYFANPGAIENILTRVTGSNPSKIFGTLGVLGEANLFLINPNGIVFGREASLDINGSFYATTGEGIKLGENGLFSATDLDPSNLLQVRPSALFHNSLANHMATLNNQANLAVPKGENLVLHGGTLTNSGSLTAPGGTVMVLGDRVDILDKALLDVSSPTDGGNVFIGTSTSLSDNGLLQGGGNIPTAARTYIGPDATISSDALETGDGGRVIVWGEEVTGFYGNISARGGLYGGDGGFVEVSGGEILRFRGQVDTTAALGKAGTLLLDPRNITIANGSPGSLSEAEGLMEIEDADSIADDIFNGAVDSPEDVTIYESQLEELSGDANVVLQATNDIKLADLSDDSMNLAPGTGDIAFIADADRDGVGDFSMEDRADTIHTNGRDIAITGPSLTLGNIDTSIRAADGAVVIDNREIGNSGAITLRATDGNITGGDLNGASFSGAGGEIRLDAAADIRLDGSQVDASGVVGGGGDITLNSGGEIELNSSFLTSSTNGRGDAGKVAISARDTVRFSGGGAFSQVNSEGSGDAGGIEITTGTLEVTDGAELNANTDGEGDAGSIKINTSGKVLFSGESSGGIRSGARSQVLQDAVGNARGIEITTNILEVTDGGRLSAGTFGEGDAGSVKINASDSVLFSGESSDKRTSGARSLVNSDAVGNAGGIEITTGTLEVTDGAELNVGTAGVGNAGLIKINAAGMVLFRGDSSIGMRSGARSQVFQNAVGNARGIEITTGTLEVTDGGRLSAGTFGEGDAGSIKINATGMVLFRGESSGGRPSGVRSQVLQDAVGNAGGIEITAGTLEVTDGALIDTSTSAEGNAGTVKINASGSVLFSGELRDGRVSGASSQVNSDAVGNAGGVEITTSRLEVTDGAQITASTAGVGDASGVKINATGSVLFSGESSQGITSGAFSTVETDAVGDARGIKITTGTLEVTDGAQISTSTAGVGDANIIRIETGVAINISGIDSMGNSSGLFAATTSEAMGEAGDIILSTQFLNLRSAGVIDARTENDSTGGDIEINTNRLEVTGGAQISSSSFSSGDAGTISIDARESVTIAATDSNYNSRVASFGEDGVDTTGPESAILSSALSTGTGGSIILKADRLRVTDGASISVSSARGIAGSLNLTADALNLNNGTISAETASGNEGNITINSALIVLQDKSEITTNARENATGGNIKIATDNLVARDDSDISANAVLGAGGNIRISSQGVFLDRDSQITATSDRGIDGTVEINSSTERASGVVQLDNNPLDAEKILAQNLCVLAKDSSFIITRRGGIAQNHTDQLQSPLTWQDFRLLDDDENVAVNNMDVNVNEVVEVTENEIRQAQGWVQLPDGTVVLTSYPVIPTPHGPLLQHPGCNDR